MEYNYTFLVWFSRKHAARSTDYSHVLVATVTGAPRLHSQHRRITRAKSGSLLPHITEKAACESDLDRTMSMYQPRGNIISRRSFIISQDPEPNFLPLY
jgi:hypothetical protein